MTPCGTPAILDEPVSLSGRLHAISNNKNTMIKILRTTLFFSVNPPRVELERLVTSINGYTAWALTGNSGLESVFISRGHVIETNIPGTLVFGIIPAGVILALVRIALLSINAPVILNVLESCVHESAVAALVTVLGATVYQVLLRETGQVACRPVVLSL